ncbi:YceI family protein [Massilia pseudoviolaceinigra]|uniref:YceI family protein n=1 Tax=Massilia pseudoviolaceinigra TaxID=3057165 RepID=UPI0027968F6C|nr:YceI family protein [Massilia sp. CCM 9206]MDQ1922492.1 YceI family protein [Massilia sp. CCM 9206]
MKKHLLFFLLAGVTGAALAAPVTYKIDPDHTFPSFEADHMGVSVWRGKFNSNSGKVTLDKAAGYGLVDISIDPASIDFGQEALNKWAAGPDLFDVAKFGAARYKGKLTGFKDGAPSQLQGELTLHGVTRPVNLQIKSFKCIQHPMLKREMCGADAYGSFKRDEFGLTAGKDYGFKMDVDLRIQVEAVAE